MIGRSGRLPTSTDEDPVPSRRPTLVRQEFIRFGLVGAVAWLVDTAVFLVLKSDVLEEKPVTAKVAAVVVATVVSYILNREWSFRARGGRHRLSEFMLFFMVSGFAVFLYAAPLWVSRYILHLQVPYVSALTQSVADFIAGQLVGVAIGMIFRWWALRRFVFPSATLEVGPALCDATRTGRFDAPSEQVELTVIIPTRNEQDTVGTCFARLTAALAEQIRTYEIIVVDDSDDDTPTLLNDLATVNPTLTVLHRASSERIGGLSGAITAGFVVARGNVVVVMDSDLQHPPEVVPMLCVKISEACVDLCVASRYIPGGSATGLDGARRRWASLLARLLVHLLIPATRAVSDPCGGFFAVRREILLGAKLEAEGFKILVEILARTNWRDCTEVPYVFVQRGGGTSNFSAKEVARFVRHLSRLTWAVRRTAVPSGSHLQ